MPTETSLSIFTYADRQVRTVMVDDEPWFVVGDVTDFFGVTNRNRAMQEIDERDKGGTQIDTPGGRQTVATVNESGLFDLLFALQPQKARGIDQEVIDRRVEQLRAFKRWVTHQVLPSIRKTGSYSTTQAIDVASPAGILALAEKFAETARALVAVTARAEVAEEFKEAIEVADGLTPREFHKHYLSDVSERVFFELMYSRGLLIDQRGQRKDKDGKPKPGKQHGHPSFRGKAFFYLHPTVDKQGNRFENTRVRPGEPELALVAFCEKHGFMPHPEVSTALFSNTY